MLAQNENREERKSESKISKQYKGDTAKNQKKLEGITADFKKLPKPRPWYNTIKEEIGIFFGILLLQKKVVGISCWKRVGNIT